LAALALPRKAFKHKELNDVIIFNACAGTKTAAFVLGLPIAANLAAATNSHTNSANAPDFDQGK
jgi:hypothetical protein